MAVKPIEERRLLGIGMILGGYLCFAIIDSCAKWLMLQGMPPLEVVFVRCFGQFLLAVALFAPREGRALVTTRRPWIQFWRALGMLGATVFNFLAIIYLPLTVTASIGFTMPFIVVGLSILLLGEKVGWRRWLAIAVGFAGVLIIIRPGTSAFHPAIFLSFGAVISSAFYMLLTRKLAGVDSSTTQQFYAAGIATLCLLPFAFNDWMWPGDLVTWAAFILIGATALVAHQLITVAHRFAPVSVLAPFNYSLIVFLTAASWLVFDQPPDIWIFVGAPIVIGSGLYIWLRERQLARQTVTELAPEG